MCSSCHLNTFWFSEVSSLLHCLVPPRFARFVAGFLSTVLAALFVFSIVSPYERTLEA